MKPKKKSIELIYFFVFLFSLTHKGIAVIVRIIRVTDTVMAVVVAAAEEEVFALEAAIVVDHRQGAAIDSAAAKINQANVCVACDGMNSN